MSGWLRNPSPARFDCVQGVWPAIWMMPKSDSIGWPVGGEIDIMEHLNYEGRVYQTIHWSQNGVPNQDNSQGVTPGWNDGAEKSNWHTYGTEWTEDPESERKRIGKRSVVLMNIMRKYRGGAAWCQ